MSTIDLKIAQLRKSRGLTQQELGDALSVSFQTVSKWENGVTLPDITLLPAISQYFDVSVDELLGLKPLADGYQPNRSGKMEYWGERFSYLERTRKEYWNQDYIQFLIEKVWKIETRVNVLDCGCGYGALGLLLLPLLPEGSTYTGMDFSGELLEKGRELFREKGYAVKSGRETPRTEEAAAPGGEAAFIEADVLRQAAEERYDLVICNAVLRHLDTPQIFLEQMIRFTKPGGLVVCMDVNREFECDGFYGDGMDYAGLCSHTGFKDMWKKELEEQGRDYAVAMKLPHLMRRLGLKQVDARMNDRISYTAPDQEGYEERKRDFLAAQGWDRRRSEEEMQAAASEMVSRGMNREDALGWCRRQNETAVCAQELAEKFAYIHMRGVVIAYGRKE